MEEKEDRTLNYQQQELLILLQKLSVVKDKIEARKDNEEKFNVFSSMMNVYDEVHLHSRFISCILDPHGSHGLDDAPLKDFVSVVGSHFKFSFDTAQVYVEYKKIDILVIDRSLRSAIIIENKIHADDSNHAEEGQIERYYRRIVEEDKIPQDNVEVYYLTLDGHDPSKESVSTSSRYPGLPSKVRNISYGNEIIAWCELCMKEACAKPFVRETLAQYIALLKDLTSNDTEDMEIREIIDVISQNEETLSSAALLAENFKHVQWFTIQGLFKDLESGLKEFRYKVVHNDVGENPGILDCIVHNGHYKQWPAIHFEDGHHLHFFIGCGWDCRDGIYYGLMKKQVNGQMLDDKLIVKINSIAHDSPIYTWENQDCVFLTYCVPSSEGIYIWDFSRKPTYMIINAKYRKEAVEKQLRNMKANLDQILNKVI